ncbi:hypothetical protein M9H77_24444 [Catharanthus roseus]|uniref:Uncharacterized protein n=1 Tax=Catharanthus roseus TaxID=4058 RepID=A0ACC0AWZ3_CATRO|nr:hypothetical protein M9H77_24444 [Catharanthus roseus]
MDNFTTQQAPGLEGKKERIEIVGRVKSGDNGKCEEWDLQTALLKKFASKGHAEHLSFQLSPRREPFTMRSVVSKQWLTRPFSLNILGSEEDRFETHSGVERLILMSGLREYEPGARILESLIRYCKCKSTFFI